MNVTEIKPTWTPVARIVAVSHDLTAEEILLVEFFALKRDTLPNNFFVTTAEVMAVVGCRQRAGRSPQSTVHSPQSLEVAA